MAKILPDDRMETRIIIIVGLIAALIGPRLFGYFNKGQINITTTPPGADVYISGEESYKTPAEIKLKQGKYSLRISSPGYSPMERTIEIKRYETTSLKLQLVPISKEDVKNK